MASKRKVVGVSLGLAAFVAVCAGLGWYFVALGSGPVRVAVIDTGWTAPAGEALGRVEPGWSFVRETEEVRDEAGHGTAVIEQVLQSCKGCTVLPLQVSLNGGAIRTQDLVRAIRFALSRDVKVINFSLGLQQGSEELQAAVREASAAGALLVTAAGLGVANPFRPSPLSAVYPQAYPEVLVVGTLDEGEQADFASNFGDELDLVLRPALKTEGKFRLSGSSGSAARMSGLAAWWFARSRSARRTPAGAFRNLVRACTAPSRAYDPSRLGFGVFEEARFLADQCPRAEAIARAQDAHNIEISAARSIQAADSAWRCPGSTAVASGVPRAQILAKGRARLTVDQKPAPECSLEVHLRFTDGATRSVRVSGQM